LQIEEYICLKFTTTQACPLFSAINHH